MHAGICAGGGPSLIGQLASRVKGCPYRNHSLQSQSTSRAGSHSFPYPRRGALEASQATAEIVREVRFLRSCREAAKGLDLLIFAGSHQLNDYVR